MQALLYVLMCLVTAPNDPVLNNPVPNAPATKALTEEESLPLLLAKKARWEESTKSLTLTGAGDFSQKDILLLRNMPSVRTLHIAYTLEDDDLATLRESGHLKTLVLTGDRFTDKAIPHVAAMPSLTALELENCSLTANGIIALSKMKHLNRLSLIQVSLGKQAVANLKTVPSLRVLAMRKTPSVTGLSGCKQLRALTLRGVDLADFDTNELVEELGNIKQLERLTLSIIEETALPLSARNWFTLDLLSGSFVATRHYPLCDRLKTSLPNTDVSIKFENRSLTFLSLDRRETITLK